MLIISKLIMSKTFRALSAEAVTKRVASELTAADTITLKWAL